MFNEHCSYIIIILCGDMLRFGFVLEFVFCLDSVLELVMGLCWVSYEFWIGFSSV